MGESGTNPGEVGHCEVGGGRGMFVSMVSLGRSLGGSTFRVGMGTTTTVSRGGGGCCRGIVGTGLDSCGMGLAFGSCTVDSASGMGLFMGA